MLRKIFMTSVLLLLSLAISAQGRQGRNKTTGNMGLTIEPAVPKYVVDIDSNFYKVVKIGNQIWMAENLKTTRLNDGTPIPFVLEDRQWRELKTPALCWYDDFPFAGDPMEYISTYGLLYNWYAVNTGKLCPDGWHVPTSDEWEELGGFLGTELAGLKMKETGTQHWTSTTSEVTNESGFTALPGGGRAHVIKDQRVTLFYYAGEISTWWSSSPVNSDFSTSFFIYAPVVQGRDNSRKHSSLRRSDLCSKDWGKSIRCMKN